MTESDLSTDSLQELLGLQLCEVEMLSSMFPSPGEFVLDDATVQIQIQDVVDGAVPYDSLACRVGFSVKVDLDGNSKHISELVCHLPHEYPAVLPVIFIRAPTLSRSQQKHLSENIQKYMASMDREENELCVGSIIQWVQENGRAYVEASAEESKNSLKKESSTSQEDSTFTRLWIYSHHIYSKFKRKDIQEYAKELNLTGFSMPGKPGMVCVEGYSRDVEDYWCRLRRMQWKRLVMKEKQDMEIGDSDLTSFRKFSNFEEMIFDPRDGKGGYHMDMGLLVQFLEKHACADIFNIYFGVDGKIVAEES